MYEILLLVDNKHMFRWERRMRVFQGKNERKKGFETGYGCLHSLVSFVSRPDYSYSILSQKPNKKDFFFSSLSLSHE